MAGDSGPGSGRSGACDEGVQVGAGRTAAGAAGAPGAAPTWSSLLESLEYDPANTPEYRQQATSILVGGLVRALREEAGLTQRQLADAAGTTQPAIARIERGGLVPGIVALSRIAEAVGRRLLVGFVDERDGAAAMSALTVLSPSEPGAEPQASVLTPQSPALPPGEPARTPTAPPGPPTKPAGGRAGNAGTPGARPARAPGDRSPAEGAAPVIRTTTTLRGPNSFVVELPLPGVDASAIDLRVEGVPGDGELCLSVAQSRADEHGRAGPAARRSDALARRVALPADVDLEDVDARFDDGVLTVFFAVSGPLGLQRRRRRSARQPSRSLRFTSSGVLRDSWTQPGTVAGTSGTVGGISGRSARPTLPREVPPA